MRTHEKVNLLQSNNNKIADEVNEILRYLSSSKFQGPDNNYVNAKEMYNRIMILRNMVSLSQYEMHITE
jgi:hypothetical protein